MKANELKNTLTFIIRNYLDNYQAVKNVIHQPENRDILRNVYKVICELDEAIELNNIDEPIRITDDVFSYTKLFDNNTAVSEYDNIMNMFNDLSDLIDDSSNKAQVRALINYYKELKDNLQCNAYYIVTGLVDREIFANNVRTLNEMIVEADNTVIMSLLRWTLRKEFED